MIIGIVLPEEHPWRDEAHRMGNVTFDRQEVTDLENAQRAPLNVLLIDATDLTSDDIPPIRLYRMGRPETRILVSLPDDAQPGSPVLAGLVGLGIYDLVQGLTLSAALDNHPTIADALRWQVADLDPETGRQKTKIEVRERVVERRVAVSKRPVLIAVAGAAAGVGTTTLACAIAGYLSRNGHKAALVETMVKEQGSLTILSGREAPGTWVPNVTIHPCAVEMQSPRDLVRSREYPYIVADLGAESEDLALLDADLLVLCIPPEAHRYWRVGGATPLEGARYVVVGGGELAALTQAVQNDFSVTPLHIPLPTTREWPAGYKHPFEPLDTALATLLGELMPDQPRRGRGFKLPSFGVRRPNLLRPQPVPQGPNGAVAVEAIRAGSTTIRTIGTMTAALLQFLVVVLETAVTLSTVGAIIWAILFVVAQTGPSAGGGLAAYNHILASLWTWARRL